MLVLVVSLLPAFAVAQPRPFAIPQDPVAAYFDLIVLPIMRYQTPKDLELVAFYRTYISIHSQVQVAEDQFAAYWKQTADRIFGARFMAAIFLGASYSLTYDIGEPTYNETRDQARFKVTTTIGIRQGFVVTYENRVMFVHVIKEGGVWKLVLSDDVVREMQKFSSKVTARRYPVAREASVSGLRVLIAALTLETDMTTLDITVENTTEASVDLLFAISGATLTDDTGKTYGSRTLRSSLPGTVAPRQTVQGSIAFFPIPPVSRRVVLSLPDVRIGSDSMNISLEFFLGTPGAAGVAAPAVTPPAPPSPQPSPTPVVASSPRPASTPVPTRPSPAATPILAPTEPAKKAEHEPKVTVTREVSSATGWAAIVKVGGVEVFRIRTSYGGLDLFQRADAAAALLNRLIRQGLKAGEVQSAVRAGRSVILARGELILTIDPELARLNGTTTGKLAIRWIANLQAALRQLK